MAACLIAARPIQLLCSSIILLLLKAVILTSPASAFVSPPIRNTRFIRSPRSIQFTLLQTKDTVMGSSFSTEVPSTKARKELKGKTVLLTGASGGLGKALALQLATVNVSTLILTARTESALQEIATECKLIGHQDLAVHCLVGDLSDPESVQSLAEKALAVSSNQIDILINNGGISSRSRFIDTSIDVDRLVMQVNYLAGAALAKAVVPGMVQRGHGRIVWISSVQGLLGIPNRSSYAASKFAVQGYCESIRSELSSSGIVVTVVSPGYIRTNLSRSAVKGDGGKYGKMDETTASGADPYEVATKILDAVAKGQAELIVAAGFSTIIAIWLRLIWPGLLRQMLVKRYEKTSKLKKE